MQTIANACPMCNGAVVGDESTRYYCKRCNIFYDKQHLAHEVQKLNTEKGIGLFIGRFQPFHQGHLFAVKEILRDCDKVIIGVGSAEKSNTIINPFTFEERKAMINEALKLEITKNWEIVALPDINDNKRWVSYVKEKVGKVTFVYTGSPLTKSLFLEENYSIVEIPRYYDISASEVRIRMVKNLRYDHLLPVGVRQSLQTIQGVERVKELYEASE